MTLPPGPSFGEYQVFRWSQGALAYFTRQFARYGDPFTMPNFARQQYLMTHDPAIIRTVFAAQPDDFEVAAPWTLQPFVGPGSILVRSGAAHKAHRRLLMPPFHGERMRSYGVLMQNIARAHGARRAPGERFLMHNLAAEIALEAILRACFGVVDAARIEKFRAAIHAFIAATNPLLIFMRSLRRPFGGVGPWARLKRAEATFHALLIEEIEARRATPLDGREDILSLLLAARDEEGAPMSDDDLRDELVTMVIAGHETTATSMSWAMYWLLRDPVALQRTRDELRSLGPTPEPDAIAKLPWLDAVCHETLRLWPVIQQISRQVRRPYAIAGFEVPTGDAIGIAVVSVHHRPDLYPEPARFRPERFLERKFGPHEFMPFGGGARRCIGAAFALYQMKIVLGTLLLELDLQLVNAHEEEEPVLRNVTWGPKHGVQVIRVAA